MVLGRCTVIPTLKFIQYTCKYFTTGDRSDRLALLKMMLPFSAQILARAYKAYYDTSLYEGWKCNSGNYLFTTDTK